MKKAFLPFLLTLLLFPLRADEGMWPLSELHKLDLRSKGLQIDSQEIYNPQGVSLIDGIVQLGGCTGSFVSSEGLIVTNHHCAFGAVQAASSQEKDYVSDGFTAPSRREEIPAKGYTVRITESYRDVSAQVLKAVKTGMSPLARTKAVEKRIKEIVADAEKKNPGKRAEVAEMFSGKSYVLFLYTYLKDLRLVYVPPRSIGEFAGEDDNWVWPRHTGDFSFLRAYVAPNGEAAEFSDKNIPYKPRKFLKVNPKGVEEGDFTFILGYPGRTYRHMGAAYLSYEEEVRMPTSAQLSESWIAQMEEMSSKNPEAALKLSSRIKGLANGSKNYRGKLAGLQRLGLVKKWREDEKRLQEFILASPERKRLYGSLLQDLENVYSEIRNQSDYTSTLDSLLRSSTLLSTALSLQEAAAERAKPDIERDGPYMDRNFPRLRAGLELSLKNVYLPAEETFLTERLIKAASLPSSQTIPALAPLGKDPDALKAFVSKVIRETRLKDPVFALKLLGQPPELLAKQRDPLLQLAGALYPTYKKLKETRQKQNGELDTLYAKFIDIRMEWMKRDFVPDANSTLRFTYGRIRGYSPRNAVTYEPLTTFAGVVEKTAEKPFYNTPAKAVELWKAKDFGPFASSKLKDIPVAMLYDMDTTGGNSGSPVLDAKGELVGINFDRAWEATVNDYAWSSLYSRSIAVDIRYVLWVTSRVGGANNLLEEMGVTGN